MSLKSRQNASTAIRTWLGRDRRPPPSGSPGRRSGAQPGDHPRRRGRRQSVIRTSVVDRQVLDAVEPRRAEADGRPRQAHVGQLVGDDVEHHLQLEPGEVGPDAVVGAAGAEGDVRVRGAADVEPPGIVEHLLVEVGRGEVEPDPLALADRLAGDLDVLGGGALEHHGGRGPAQDLVDRGRRAVPTAIAPTARDAPERRASRG